VIAAGKVSVTTAFETALGPLLLTMME